MPCSVLPIFEMCISRSVIEYSSSNITKWKWNWFTYKFDHSAFPDNVETDGDTRCITMNACKSVTNWFPGKRRNWFYNQRTWCCTNCNITTTTMHNAKPEIYPNSSNSLFKQGYILCHMTKHSFSSYIRCIINWVKHSLNAYCTVYWIRNLASMSNYWVMRYRWPLESSFNKSTMHSIEWWGTDGVQFQQINHAFYWVMRYRWSPVSTNQRCILLSDEVPMATGVQFQQINHAFCKLCPVPVLNNY